MAGFQDIIPTFNPYVQQQPVEAMVAVGMEKQKRFEEGVEKIQSSIDKVTGLDIVRDVDRQYLQSKLNELSTNLKTVAAGDFSNFQLVKSVSGMAGKVAKDNNVINAVTSTAKYRKEVEAMETARKEGKSAIQNEWDFMTRTNPWLNSKNVGESYNERYTQYIDVEKKWFDVVKSLHSDLNEQDIAESVTYKDDGSIDTVSTLKAMQRRSTEKVSSAKIENALRASMSPDELNQLAIDGRYQFRDATPETISSYITSKYTSEINDNEKMIKDLEGKLNMSSSDAAEQNRSRTAIEEIKKRNDALRTSLTSELQYVATNPEEAKIKIYKDSAITQFANALSWEHDKRNILTNPIAVYEQNEREYAAKLAKELSDSKSKTPVVPYTSYGARPELGTSPHLAIKNDIVDINAEIDASIKKVAKDIGASPEQISNAIARYNGRDPEWYNDPSGAGKKEIIPIEHRDEIYGIIDNQRKARNLAISLRSVESEVDNSEEFKTKVAGIRDKISKLNGAILNDESGRPVQFTAQEIYDYLNKIETTTTPSAANPIGVIGKAYKVPLTAKEQMLDRYNGVFPNEAISKVREATRQDQLTIEKDRSEAINKLLEAKHGDYIPKTESVPFAKTGERGSKENWDDYANMTLNKYIEVNAGMKGGAETMKKGDVEKVRGWFEGEARNDLIYQVFTQGSDKSLIVKKGSDEVVIPIEPVLAAQIPQIDPSEPSGEYADIYRTQTMFKGKTNPDNTFENAYFGRNWIPNTSHNIKADFSWNTSNTAMNYITLRWRIPGKGEYTTQVRNSNGDIVPFDRDSAMMLIRGLTDRQIKDLFSVDKTLPKEILEYIKTL